MITQGIGLIHTFFFFFCVKGIIFTDTMSTSKTHSRIAWSFFSYSPIYIINPVKEEDISLGRRTFGEIYARIIQRAYRRYRKKPASLAKCAWNAIRYYDNRKELRGYSANLYSQLGEKRGLYRFQLGILAVTLLLNILF
jgi:hypothetical protein